MVNKEIIKFFEGFRYTHGLWVAFRDFCEISAISFSNVLHTEDYETREKRYLEIIKEYSRDEIETMIKILALVGTELYSNKSDVLGGIYQALSVNDKSFGQFFTPSHISDAMAEMMLGDGVGELIERKGYISVCEPCVGSGTMVISAAKSLERKGYNPSECLVAEATDLDIVCTHMAYIQFCLLGIPAIVYNGNSLNNNILSTWITPMYAEKFLVRKEGQEDIV